MALCDSCLFYNKEYDFSIQQFDDVPKIGNELETHFCPMYLEGIPNEIYYDNGDCEYYENEGDINAD